MIPIPVIWTTLRAIPWRPIGWSLLVAGVALAGWRVSAWHDAYERLQGVQDALEAERLCREGSECWKRQAAFTEAVGHETVRIVTGYEAELAALRGRKPRVVRLCPPGGLPDAATPGSADGAAPGGIVPGQVGENIGPDLYGLARDADELRLRLKYLQQWNRAAAGE